MNPQVNPGTAHTISPLTALSSLTKAGPSPSSPEPSGTLLALSGLFLLTRRRR